MDAKEKKQYCMRFVGGERTLLKDDLVYVESYGRKVYFQMVNGQYVAYRKLNQVEEELADRDFLRIHQSYLVNMNFINNIHRYQAYLKSGLALPVPRTRYRQVKESYQYWKKECMEPEW